MVPGTKKKVATKKKPTPVASKNKLKSKSASIEAQKAWKGFSPKLKKELRKTLPDTDRDRVPNGFDCQPRNRRRQESFLSADAAYLNSNPAIMLGKVIGEGSTGAVYTVKDNANLVVKVPLGYGYSKRSTANRSATMRDSKQLLAAEIGSYNDYSLEGEPLFIPTRVVELVAQNGESENAIGMVRPRVKISHRLTDDQLEQLRRKVINLSHKGFLICDWLQVGVDKAGRVLLFDLGGLVKRSPSMAFKNNNKAWRNYLIDSFKLRWGDEAAISNLLAKYGTINPDEYY